MESICPTSPDRSGQAQQVTFLPLGENDLFLCWTGASAQAIENKTVFSGLRLKSPETGWHGLKIGPLDSQIDHEIVIIED
ncbi:hypothetical protein LV564_02610 [Komagataeibacter nataicola]|nr:hypothetical protein [Komagataeibacter nataicola]WEQ56018.1 hypothetical protein LV564_02610 [Komagataeibacter nataicola]WNM07445.1 hypothetical protein RI056_09910 [Komagataeibacter nataicola]